MPRLFSAWVPVLTYLVLAFAVAFNLHYLYPEAAIRIPYLNDNVQHLLAVRTALEGAKAHQDPTDAWLPGIVLGYPLSHYYQHLPYALPALVEFVTREAVALDAFFSWIGYLLLSIFPLSIYWSMRRFGFDRLPAVLAGLVASLLATNGLFGFDFTSYVWRGFGLYTQLWGMILLPPALAQGYSVLRTGRGYLWAIGLLAAATLSHLAFGYTAYASIGLFALVSASRSTFWVSMKRLVLLVAPVAAATSYFLVPLLLDSAYLNHSVWDAQWKYDSFGHQKILGMLIHGEIFDFGRFPSLTILAGVGLLVCVRRWREVHYRIPLVFSIFWLLLYFGRPTWGALLDITPLARDFYLHRLIAGVHLGGIYLMGLGLALPWNWARARAGEWPVLTWSWARAPANGWASRASIWARGRVSTWPLLAPAILMVMLLIPVYRERAAFLDYNTVLMTNEQKAYATEAKDLTALMDQLRSLPPGRVYAGLAGTWGATYRVGEVYMYALLTQDGFDVLSFLYHVWSLNGDVQVLFDEQRPEQYNLFNIRYVVSPLDRTFPDFVRPVQDFGRHRLYEVDTTGYFDLVGSDLTFVGGRADFYQPASRWLQSDEPRVKQHPIINFNRAPVDSQRSFPLRQAGAHIPTGQLPLDTPRGQIVSETVAPNTYQAVVEVERGSELMLKVTYHPNWHAYVDGVETPTFMLMPSYVGINISPGTHQVRLEYRPQPLRSALLIFGILTLVLVGVAERRRDIVVQLAARVPFPPPVLAPGFAALGRQYSIVLAATASRLDASPPNQWRIVLLRWSEDALALLRSYRVVLRVEAAAATEVRPAVRRVEPEAVAEAGPAALRSSLRALGGSLSLHLPYLGALGVMTLVAGWPLLQLKLMSGHDYLEYVPRSVEFYRALTGGQLLPRWAPDLSAGYGEPFFNFNPPVIYATTAFFHALGFSFLAGENLACFALLALTGLGMYLLASEFFGRRGGLVAATAYLFAPFLDSRLYVSHALADYSAFSFIPFAIWGLYRFAEGGGFRFLLVGALSGALLLLSSNPIALISFPALVLLVGLLSWTTRSVRVALRGAWCLGIGVGLAAFFWLPAMAERNFVHLHRLLETFLNYHNHFAYPFQLLFAPWGFGASVPGTGDGMSFALGPVHLLAAAASLVLVRRIWVASVRVGVMVAFSLVLLFVGAFMSIGESTFIWDRLPLLQYLEYPWRFHTLAAVGTAFLCGAPFLLLASSGKWLANGAAGVLVLVVLASNVSHARPERFTDVKDADFSPQKIVANALAVTTANEYDPIWVVDKPGPAAAPVTVLSGQAQVGPVRRTSAESQFRVEADGEARLRINTFYFPGWTLYVDGVPRPIERANPQGAIELSVRGGAHQVRLAFEDTPVRSWSMKLSLLALLLLLATPWLDLQTRRSIRIRLRHETHRAQGYWPRLATLVSGVLSQELARIFTPSLTLPRRGGGDKLDPPPPSTEGGRVEVGGNGSNYSRVFLTRDPSGVHPSSPDATWRTLPVQIRWKWAERLERIRLTDRHFRLAFYALAGILTVLIVRTVTDYGLSWDEDLHKLYGDFVARWYLTLGHDRSALFGDSAATTQNQMSVYGGLFEIAAHIVGPLLPLGVYEGRHLVSAGFGLLGIVTAFGIGKHLAGSKAGFFAALFLALTPVYYGQMFFNPKDIPFAALNLLGLYALFLLFDAFPRVSKRHCLFAGVAIGSALGVRVAGVLLLFGSLGFLAAAWLASRVLSEGRFSRPIWNETVRVAATCALTGLLAWGVMIVWWPWAQVHPIGAPLDVLRVSLDYNWQGTVFFDGQTFPVAQLPQQYLLTWLAISLPEFYLMALGLAGLLGALSLKWWVGQRLGSARYPREALDLARVARGIKVMSLVLAGCLPITIAVLHHSQAFDGLRLFLFTLPPLAVLAGLSIAAAFESPRLRAPVKALVGAALLLTVGTTVVDLARLHPYEYIYFNRLVAGGEQAGAQRFETDYWGLSYKEGVDWLVANYRSDTASKIAVSNCSKPILSGYFLEKTAAGRQRFASVRPDQGSHIFLATTRFDCQNVVQGRTLHIVERAGVPLLYVIQMG